MIDTRKIKFYDFNLDLPLDERYKEIFDDHKNIIPRIKPKIREILDEYGFAINLLKPVYYLTPKTNLMYFDEINYLAHFFSMTPLEGIIMQLIYETFSACTTAIIDVNDKKLFLRTMDWDMTFLKELTVGLNIYKKNKLIARAVTWVGYVGLLTAISIKNNVEKNYTLAINYRRTQSLSLYSILKNFFRVITLRWPIGYLIRNIIEKKCNVDKTIKILRDYELISPCYITVYHQEKSCVITRNCDSVDNIRYNNLVQTNCDFDKIIPNILWSTERRDHVNDIIKDIKKKNKINESDIKIILSRLLNFPVLNEETIYFVYQYNYNFDFDDASIFNPDDI